VTGPQANDPSEDDMNENQGRRGPGLWPLLLIPAVLIIAKGARRRREMWAGVNGYGGHHRFVEGGFDAEGRPEFRLPPKLERVLDEWHTRVHEAASEDDAAPATRSAKATGTATA
jgi:hypothetical protein